MIDIPPGWATVIVAVVAMGASAIGGLFAWLQSLNRRTAQLRIRLEQLERRDRLSWLYIQSLIHHAYKHNAVPLPEPPEGWNDID